MKHWSEVSVAVEAAREQLQEALVLMDRNDSSESLIYHKLSNGQMLASIAVAQAGETRLKKAD